MSKRISLRSQRAPQQLPDYTMGNCARDRVSLRTIAKAVLWIVIGVGLIWIGLTAIDGLGGLPYLLWLATPALAVARVAAKPVARRKSAAIVGEVRNFRDWTESTQGGTTTWIVWTFCVERFDEHGNPLPLVPVQMRGMKFRGSINEGDRVEVRSRWRPGRTLTVNSVRNLSTGATVRSGRAVHWSDVAGWIISLAIIGGIIAACAAAMQ